MLTNAGEDFGFSDFCCSAPSNWDEVINGAFRRIDPDLADARLFSGDPIPAAAWLFGSALLGLVGIKRKK